MNIYGLTDKGLVRKANEDSIGITCAKNGIVIAIVCDGMGGVHGGKVASEIAETTFMSHITSLLCADGIEASALDNKTITKALKESVDRANLAVFEKSRADSSLLGMGCTLCACVFSEPKSKIYYANVGDSRMYMISPRKIVQMTKDHSYVQMLVDNKEITKEEAEIHPKRNLITRALGIKEEVEADISYKRVNTKAEHYFLLCSDGLHGMVKSDVLRKVAIAKMSTEEKIFTYIKLANEAGGDDNISAILLDTKESEVSK